MRGRSMKTTIYLTRHGQTEWNLETRLQGRGDSALTSEGIKGAQQLAKRVATLQLECIYTSPLTRAIQTAQLIRGRQEIPIIQCEDLVEMSFGEYEGQRIEDLKKQNAKWDIRAIMAGDLVMCAPGGETQEALRQRVAYAMDNILKQNKGKTLLIVGHGMTLKAVMYYFNDLEATGTVMRQTTLTKIEIEETTEARKVHIVYKNDGQHLTLKSQQMGW